MSSFLFDVLETDHAPHTLEDKTERYMSGIPGLASWPDFVSILERWVRHREVLHAVSFDNINKIYGLNIPKLNLPVQRGKHLNEYCLDAYS